MFLYIANWKMNLPFYKARDFCEDNYYGFEVLSKVPDKKIVLCPSFIEIIPVLAMFEDLELDVGAQNCSSSQIGAYTGQVPALSLAQIGCKYCIVGHSEAREYLSESDRDVSEKVLRLLETKITPILCVGENKQNYEADRAKEVLLVQLAPVFENIRELGDIHMCIAYEPIWSIGTGIVPEVDYIEKIFDFILETGKKICPSVKMTLLYGGSVNENNVKSMKNMTNLGGFLIGSASLDFKKFEKIVQL